MKGAKICNYNLVTLPQCDYMWFWKIHQNTCSNWLHKIKNIAFCVPLQELLLLKVSDKVTISVWDPNEIHRTCFHMFVHTKVILAVNSRCRRSIKWVDRLTIELIVLTISYNHILACSLHIQALLDTSLTGHTSFDTQSWSTTGVPSTSAQRNVMGIEPATTGTTSTLVPMYPACALLGS